jgi:hypothetical protein
MSRYQEITPIQTKYKGYHFRSRLEARWAVFFEELEIKFHYEFEDVVVNGKRCLPDFFFPHFKIMGHEFEHGAYGEVKPFFTPDDIRRCIGITQISKKPVLLLDSVPDFKETRCILIEDGQWIEETGILYSGAYIGSAALDCHEFYTESGYFTEYDIERLESEFKHAVYASRAARF